MLGACICWGFENNCTKMISNKSSTEIVIIKGFFSGMGSLLIAFFLGERLPEAKWIAAILLLGFVAYGLSIKFYIMAQQQRLLFHCTLSGSSFQHGIIAGKARDAVLSCHGDHGGEYGSDGKRYLFFAAYSWE